MQITASKHRRQRWQQRRYLPFSSLYVKRLKRQKNVKFTRVLLLVSNDGEWMIVKQAASYLFKGFVYWTDLVACGMPWVPVRAAAVKAPTTLIHMTACVAKKKQQNGIPLLPQSYFFPSGHLRVKSFRGKIVTRWVARMTATNTSITKEYIITSRVKPDGKTPWGLPASFIR
jgi:hypothetical protein